MSKDNDIYLVLMQHIKHISYQIPLWLPVSPPYNYILLLSTACKQIPFLANSKIVNSSLMIFKRFNLISSLNFPDFDCFVPRAGDEVVAVWSEYDWRNTVGVPFKSSYTLHFREIPNFNLCIVGARS